MKVADLRRWLRDAPDSAEVVVFFSDQHMAAVVNAWTGEVEIQGGEEDGREMQVVGLKIEEQPLKGQRCRGA